MLIVEDSPVYRQILAQRIPGMQLNGSLTVDFAGDLKHARSVVRTYDMLVVDLSLPDSPPENTFAWALEIHKRLPVVILTGTMNREFVRMAKIKGLGFVIKSNSMEALEVEIIGAQAIAERRCRRMEMLDEFADALAGLER